MCAHFLTFEFIMIHLLHAEPLKLSFKNRRSTSRANPRRFVYYTVQVNTRHNFDASVNGAHQGASRHSAISMLEK
jgi:hypothetical protein